jgi:DNA modification methylase
MRDAAPDLVEKYRNDVTVTISKIRTERKVREHKRRKAQAQAAVMPVETPELRIIHGDCTSELARLRAESVHLAFADPPYNQGVDYGQGEKADRLPRVEYLARCGEWMKDVARVLTADGSFWVLINPENSARFELLLEDAGLSIRQRIIWYEAFGENNPHGFNRTHRYLFWTVKNPRQFVFHPEAVNRPSDRQTKYNDHRAASDGKTWDSVWGINPAIPRVVGSSWERLLEFPTQLPVRLLLPIVACASAAGDLVLDPFCGSGTTGRACALLGRRFLGIEESENFCDLARRTLHPATIDELRARLDKEGRS